MDSIIEIAMGLEDNEGICKDCKEVAYGVEPDVDESHGYKCESCGGIVIGQMTAIISFG